MPTETMRFERALHVAVVAELELHAARDALALRPPLGHRELLAAEGDAQHLQLRRHVRQRQPEAAPAAADVEQPTGGGSASLAAMWAFLAACASSRVACGWAK